MGFREDNQAVFQDTEKQCYKNKTLANVIAESNKKQVLYKEKDKDFVKPDLNRYEEKANIVISKKRSYEAANAYAKDTKVAVHNFASAKNPGGGVVNGASAQEECLCRCSTLYFNLSIQKMWDEFYTPHRRYCDELYNDDIIYTPGVKVFKTDTANPVTMPESDWYDVDVITCAAPNLRQRQDVKDDALAQIHEKRLRKILDVAVANGAETVILGAFGCGAFMNNPNVVAKVASKVIPDYLYAFKNIEFAVYCSPRDSRNYEAFKKALE